MREALIHAMNAGACFDYLATITGESESTPSSSAVIRHLLALEALPILLQSGEALDQHIEKENLCPYS